jgi:hypothetical protein
MATMKTSDTQPEQKKQAFTLRIIDARVQTVWLARKVTVTLKRGPDKGKNVERKRQFKVTLGTYMEFNDGCTIAGPDGRTHKGRGTVVRFNYKHGTWSVQRPEHCETNRVGYVFTPQGEPCWLKVERESGITPLELERSFSAGFVNLCLAGSRSGRNEWDGIWPMRSIGKTCQEGLDLERHQDQPPITPASVPRAYLLGASGNCIERKAQPSVITVFTSVMGAHVAGLRGVLHGQGQ